MKDIEPWRLQHWLDGWREKLKEAQYQQSRFDGQCKMISQAINDIKKIAHEQGVELK